MQDIADDSHGEIAKVFFVMPDGVHVQQALGRVGMATVTGINHMHMRRHMLRNQVGRARFAVPNHKNIGGHGAEISDRIQQRFALGSRGARNVQIDHIGR